eukprot:1965430-Lingulodinium_polyedra.AAC.1
MLEQWSLSIGPLIAMLVRWSTSLKGVGKEQAASVLQVVLTCGLGSVAPIMVDANMVEEIDFVEPIKVLDDIT